MGDKSKIEWTDATWNPFRGCSRISEGCRNCYAERMAARFSKTGEPYYGFAQVTSASPRWTGKVEMVESQLDQPLRWRKPRKIFVNSMSDTFHESAKEAWTHLLFAVMAMCPQHTFLVLTKRAERMNDYLAVCDDDAQELFYEWGAYAGDLLYRGGPDGRIERFIGECHSSDYTEWIGWPLPNVWLGVSVEDQATADERIPWLLKTPAAKRFVSYEPALGPVDFAPWINELDWIIAGGESGPGARPAHPDWFRSVRDQCNTAGVPFFFKQWGEWVPSQRLSDYRADDVGVRMQRIGKKAAGALLDGREWREWPS